MQLMYFGADFKNSLLLWGAEPQIYISNTQEVILGLPEGKEDYFCEYDKNKACNDRPFKL